MKKYKIKLMNQEHHVNKNNTEFSIGKSDDFEDYEKINKSFAKVYNYKNPQSRILDLISEEQNARYKKILEKLELQIQRGKNNIIIK